jgi:hypothetical protein
VFPKWISITASTENQNRRNAPHANVDEYSGSKEPKSVSELLRDHLEEKNTVLLKSYVPRLYLKCMSATEDILWHVSLYLCLQ